MLAIFSRVRRYREVLLPKWRSLLLERVRRSPIMLEAFPDCMLGCCSLNRVLITLLVVVLGGPAAGWTSSSGPAGIELIGPTCCTSQSDLHSKRELPEIEEACCCSPSSPAATIEISRLGPPIQEDLYPSPTLLYSTDTPLFTAVSLNTKDEPARGPPPTPTPTPTSSLLVQQTSLQI